MDLFMPRLLLRTSRKACHKDSASSSYNEVFFSIVDDNARLPHDTLRAQANAQVSPEESLEMSFRRWEGSIESTSSTWSSSSSLLASPRARNPFDDSFNSSCDSFCRPVCPQRRPSDPRSIMTAVKAFRVMSTQDAAKKAMQELRLAENCYLSDDDE